MRGYVKGLMDVFDGLGTVAQEWEPLIPTHFEDKNPVFELPFGYKTVEPLYKQFPKLAEYYEDGRVMNCQLCFHPIWQVWMISHNNKKLLLPVGCDCVEAYLNIKIKKEARISIIKNEFFKWLPNFRKQFWQRWRSNGNYLPLKEFGLVNRLDDCHTHKKRMSLIRELRKNKYQIPERIRQLFPREQLNPGDYF